MEHKRSARAMRTRGGGNLCPSDIITIFLRTAYNIFYNPDPYLERRRPRPVTRCANYKNSKKIIPRVEM